MADPGRALGRALLDLAGPGAAIVAARATPWASATFSGERHAIEIDLPAERGASTAAHLRRILPRHQFALPGHLVADIAIARTVIPAEGHVRIFIEALTLEEV